MQELVCQWLETKHLWLKPNWKVWTFCTTFGGRATCRLTFPFGIQELLSKKKWSNLATHLTWLCVIYLFFSSFSTRVEDVDDIKMDLMSDRVAEDPVRIFPGVQEGTAEKAGKVW